jgi:omega-hydroxy-beta-dihydromenaquinone-9 sulfotransferase
MTSQSAREWAPRLWQGVDFFAWLKLLRANRFAVEPGYAYIAGIASAVSLTHTALRWLQHGRYGDALRTMPTPREPIFVLGHWRTGTTLLHELLMLDPRHTAPDTAHCFAPTAPLIARDFLKKYLSFLMPAKRPMDNMPAGWDRPQECEFALCLLGQPSPYADIAFPNRGPVHPGSLDLSGLTPRQRDEWGRALVQFTKIVARRDPRRLVLKSPPHTARVPELLKLFPDAKFVHIVRDPYVVFASTVNLWNSFARRHGLQTLHASQSVDPARPVGRSAL